MSPDHFNLAGAAGRARGPHRALPVFGAAALLVTLVACNGGAKNGVLASPAPQFTTQPADATVVAGQTATFTASASNAPTYQWLANGAAVAGAQAATYVTPATTPADNNTVLAVVAQNGGGAVTSAYATLHVNYATVTTQPANVSVGEGQDATFTVAASGTGALSYQWNLNGAPMAGQTATTLTVPAATLAQMAAYSCTVTSTLNGTTATATSAAGNLKVITAAPAVTLQPADQTVVMGSTATFSVTASEGLAYQWSKNGYPIEGATSASYTTVPTMATDDNAAYQVMISNPVGSLASFVAHLHVAYALVNAQPASAVVPEGSSLTLAPTISTSGATTYQWTKDGSALGGATALTYAIPTVAQASAGSYVCTATGVLNGVTAQVATIPAVLQVVPKPVLTTQPEGGAFIVGNAMNLTVATNPVSTGLVTYQWSKNGTPITGAFAANYQVAALAATDSGSYTCAVTNTWRSVTATTTSQAAVVSVTGSPTITAQPSSVTVYAGRPATFTVAAQGPGTLHYQWYRNGAALSGATQAAYALATTALADTGSTFYCTVDNGIPPAATSSTATLTVNPVPVGSAPVFNASSQLITAGQGVVFTYLFDSASTATFTDPSVPDPGQRTFSVTSGQFTTVYPSATTTYVLTVTNALGVATPLALPVTVKSYNPNFLFILNQGENSIYQYPVNAASPVTLDQGTEYFDTGATVPANALVGQALTKHAFTGSQPVHMAATFDERYVFVCNNADATLSVYGVDPATSHLLEVTGSPFALPSGFTHPWCSSPDPASMHLYVACNEGIAVFALNAATGALTAAPTLGFTNTKVSKGDLIVHPSGKFLYLADSGHSLIKAFTIGADGGLQPNGSDMPVTFNSGLDPTFGSVNINNPSNLTLDRAGLLLFTRSTDPLVYQHGGTYVDTNAAIESYQVDPYTGVLSHWVSSSSPAIQNSYYLVEGAVDGNHSLLYTARSGVDHLLDTYYDPVYGNYGFMFSDLTVVDEPSSPDFGKVPGYFSDLGGAYPWYPSGLVWDSTPFDATGLVQDRSGQVFTILMGAGGTQKIVPGGVLATGGVAFMGNGTATASVTTGPVPYHGLFLGTMN